MDNELTFSSDPNALVHMICEVCARLCGDTYDIRDNALTALVLDNTAREDITFLQDNCDLRAAKRLIKIMGVLTKSLEAFIWRKKRQQDLIKEMTAQYEKLNKITERYCADIFEEDDFRELRKMLEISTLYLERLDLFFANDKQKATAENELRELIDEISSLIEEYPPFEDEDLGDEVSLDISEEFCPVCKGSGIMSFCSVCGGNGVDMHGGECSGCAGAGWEDCPECGGKGTLW